MFNKVVLKKKKKDEILAVTEAATPQNTKKDTKIGLSQFTAP